jgi:hypothetical protein
MWFLNGEKITEEQFNEATGKKSTSDDSKSYPVVVNNNNRTEWRLDGKLDGKLHREDGPAVEWPAGTKEWYLNGKQLTEEQFNEATGKKSTIVKLAEKAGSTHKQNLGVYQFYEDELRKFVELIVEECIDKSFKNGYDVEHIRDYIDTK